MRYFLAVVAILTFLSANANEHVVERRNTVAELIGSAIDSASNDTYMTLGDIVSNNPDLNKRRAEAEQIARAILRIYDYKGYFEQYRIGLNNHSPIAEETNPAQVAYLQCLQDSFSHDKYSEHLVTYSLIYVNLNEAQEPQRAISLLSNPFLTAYYRHLANIWEYSLLLKNIDNDSTAELIKNDSTAKLIEYEKQQIIQMSKEPELLKSLQELNDYPALQFLLNHSMLTTFEVDDSILGKFQNASATICTVEFNRELYKMIEKSIPTN